MKECSIKIFELLSPKFLTENIWPLSHDERVLSIVILYISKVAIGDINLFY